MKNFSLLILILLLTLSCDFLENKDKSTPEIKFTRFDKQLLLFDEKQFETSDTKMKKEFGELYTFYIEQLLGIGQTSKPDSMHFYKEFFPHFFALVITINPNTECQKLHNKKLPS